MIALIALSIFSAMAKGSGVRPFSLCRRDTHAREGGRKGGKGGREGGKGGREGGGRRGRERKGGRNGGREGWREGREGGKRGREGREGERERECDIPRSPRRKQV
jgi:hypothetical protein